MKLEAGKWYTARNGSKWHVDWVGERNANAHDENGEARLYYPDGTWGGKSTSHPADLISEYTPPPAEGSREWAMALPEGTRIRRPCWSPTAFMVKTHNGFVNHKGGHMVDPKPNENDWIIYKPNLRPWKAEEVPLGAWVRYKPIPSRVSMIVGYDETTLFLGGVGCLEYTRAADDYEHSLDGGKTWLPCGVEE